MTTSRKIQTLRPCSHAQNLHLQVFCYMWHFTHISKSIFNLRSHANSVNISILKVTLDQLYFDSRHVQTVS